MCGKTQQKRKTKVCENEEAKYTRKAFLDGNIFDDDFDLLKQMNEYKFPEYIQDTNNKKNVKVVEKDVKQ